MTSALRWPHHLLDVDGLVADELQPILDLARRMREARERRERLDLLRGRLVATVFYEPSTRTRLSFDLAARALGGDVMDLPVDRSSVAKGESLADTVRTLAALGADVLVMRHAEDGAPARAAEVFPGPVVSAGDGTHAHPTQALLDLLTLQDELGPRLHGARIAILGDVVHSRVARSNVATLTAMGARVTLCGPAEWLHGLERWAGVAAGAVGVTADIEEALTGADAVMTLRVQRERMAAGDGPTNEAYAARYQLTGARLAAAAPDAVVLHPGPLNEGVEIAADVAYEPRSRITRQVTNGVAVRMAVLARLVGAG